MTGLFFLRGLLLSLNISSSYFFKWAPIVKKISITTDTYSSSGCGLGPSDSLIIEQDGNEESVHLKCTEL
jgi:hypothetical protein